MSIKGIPATIVDLKQATTTAADKLGRIAEDAKDVAQRIKDVAQCISELTNKLKDSVNGNFELSKEISKVNKDYGWRSLKIVTILATVVFHYITLLIDSDGSQPAFRELIPLVIAITCIKLKEQEPLLRIINFIVTNTHVRGKIFDVVLFMKLWAIRLCLILEVIDIGGLFGDDYASIICIALLVAVTWFCREELREFGEFDTVAWAPTGIIGLLLTKGWPHGGINFMFETAVWTGLALVVPEVKSMLDGSHSYKKKILICLGLTFALCRVIQGSERLLLSSVIHLYLMLLSVKHAATLMTVILSKLFSRGGVLLKVARVVEVSAELCLLMYPSFVIGIIARVLEESVGLGVEPGSHELLGLGFIVGVVYIGIFWGCLEWAVGVFRVGWPAH